MPIIGQIHINDTIQPDPTAISATHKVDNMLIYIEFGRKSDDAPLCKVGTDEEHWLSFVLQGVTSTSTLVVDKKISFDKSDVKIEYDIDQGELKETITLKTKPAQNTLVFDYDTSGINIKLTEDQLFCYERDEITKESGSLLFHSSKPIAIDSEGSKQDVKVTIDDETKTITFTIDQTWLDKAVYPVTIDPTVSTTTTVNALINASHRYTHAISGTQFVAFHDGTEPVSSYNAGAGWQTPVAVFSSLDPAVGAWGARWIGTRIDVIGGFVTPYYRQGSLSSSGISWGYSDKAMAGNRSFRSNPVKDSADYPWGLGYFSNSNANHRVQRNPQTDGQGTWPGATDLGVPDTNRVQGLIFDVSGIKASRDVLVVSMVGFTESLDSKFYDFSIDTWDASWTNIEVEANLGANNWLETFAGTQDSSGNVYVIVRKIGGDIGIWQWNGTSWSEKNSAITGATDVSKCTISADTDDLYVFYNKSTVGNGNGIYYKKSTDSGANWGSEQTLKSDDSNTLQGAISSYEQSGNSEIGVVWVENAGSPYDVVFDKISVGAPPAVSIPVFMRAYRNRRVA